MPDMSKFDMSKLDIDVTKMKNSFFRSVGGGSAEPLIPLPREEIPEVQIPAVTQEAARQKGPRELTDAEVEAVIGDLFEYFDSCISVLRHSLSDSGVSFVLYHLPAYSQEHPCSLEDCDDEDLEGHP